MLIRKGFEAARVGAIGADLIAAGHRQRLGSRHIEALSRHPDVDYSCWRKQLVAGSWLGMSSTVALPGTSENGQTSAQR